MEQAGQNNILGWVKILGWGEKTDLTEYKSLKMMMKGKNRRGKSYMKKWQWAHIMKDNWSTQTTHLEWSQKHGGIRQEWRVSAAEPRDIIVCSDLLLLLLSQDAHHAEAQLPESVQFSIINCLNLQFNEVSKSKPYIGISSLCDNKKTWTTRV